MKLRSKVAIIVVLCHCLPVLHAVDSSSATDPFQLFLDGHAPEIIRVIPCDTPPPPGVALRKVVFRLRGDKDGEVFAAIAAPEKQGVYPGILVLHGGKGVAEVDKAISWAKRGYIAVAPDLPGIADPQKLKDTKGWWSPLNYGEGRWIASPDASESVIFDAVLSAMKSLELLRAQPGVDPNRIGVVGVSWGGYMTTMVCGLAGDKVRAGFAIYGCGFFDLGSGGPPAEPYNPKLPRSSLSRMPRSEYDLWLRDLDAGRRAPHMKAAYFLAAAADDFFGWPAAAQATLNAVPGEKNHFYAPNANHSAPIPGGSAGKELPDPNFKPTTFQQLPTPKGQAACWMDMEIPYFEYYLKGQGQPLPKVKVTSGTDVPRHVSFKVESQRPVAKADVYWAPALPSPATSADVTKRKWTPVTATQGPDQSYYAELPDDAAVWFALVSDDRPVSVSSDLLGVSPDPR